MYRSKYDKLTFLCSLNVASIPFQFNINIEVTHRNRKYLLTYLYVLNNLCGLMIGLMLLFCWKYLSVQLGSVQNV